MASADDIAKAIFGAIGNNDEESTVSQFLDTGYPELNYALASRWDGGMPVGRVVEMFGPPSSGKTAISTRAMASAQKMGGIAAFMDHERSFSMTLAPNLGLDITPGRLIFKKPRTFEESLNQVIKLATVVREKKLIAKEAPICVVFDSLASMVPQSKLYDKDGKDRELDGYTMHDNTALARATSAALPAFNQMAEELSICAIFLNQMRLKPGVAYGDPTTTPGGEAPKFYSSVRIQLGAQKIAKGAGEAKEIIGSQINARVIKNKVARPFLTASWRFVFQEDGSGKFDVTRSMIDFLLREKRLEKSGNYIVWDGNKFYADALSAKIDKDGTYDQLLKLLPASYEPPVVASLDEDEPAV